MFWNRCASNCNGGCRCCGCQSCCNWGENDYDSNQYSGTVSGYMPVTVSYTMSPNGTFANGFDMIDDAAAANSGCGCDRDCGCGCRWGCGCNNVF